MIRAAYKNLLLLFLSVIFVFTIGEVALNIIDFVNTKKNAPPLRSACDLRIFRNDPTLNKVHIPGTEFVYTAKSGKEFSTPTKLNSKGLNDYEYEYRKPENTERIVVLGDSFVEAMQVPIEENFSKVLEKKLNQQNARKYEIINMGVSGYSPILEYLYLKNEGFKYKPNMVVLGFFMNDVYEDAMYKNLATFDINNLPLSVHYKGEDKRDKLKGWKKAERKFSRAFKRVVNRSKFYVFLKKKVYALLAKTNLEEENVEESDQFFILKPEPHPEEPVLWSETFHYIRAIKDLCTDKKAEFLLLVIPIESELTENPDDATYRFYFAEKPYTKRADETIKNFCERYDIKYINLRENFKEKGAQNLYFKNDGHFNENGHREVAEILFEQIKGEK